MGCGCNSSININNIKEDTSSIPSDKLSMYNICIACSNNKLISIFNMVSYRKCSINKANIRTLISTNQHCPINKF